MSNFLKDPLVHFLILGAGLFVVLAWLDQPEDSDSDRIVITAEQVEETRRAAAILRGREPTPEELEELLEPIIREQVLYREALALGLDRDDETVRLRLVEKMQFLAQDLAEPAPPTEEALERYFAAQPERFVVPALVTFEQIYFSPAERGEQLEADAGAALESLRGGAVPHADLGDRSPLQARYQSATRERVEILFGDVMAEAVFAMEAGRWEGPFRSDFGLHLARLIERSEAYQPELADVRDTVLETYLADRRREANETEYRRMRERYDIVIGVAATEL
jgi:peptidyl-prolyl cis-trans isomerase C